MGPPHISLMFYELKNISFSPPRVFLLLKHQRPCLLFIQNECTYLEMSSLNTSNLIRNLRNLLKIYIQYWKRVTPFVQ